MPLDEEGGELAVRWLGLVMAVSTPAFFNLVCYCWRLFSSRHQSAMAAACPDTQSE